MSRTRKIVAGAAVGLGLALFLMPAGVFAGPDITPTPKASHGLVSGRIVDLHSTPVPGAQVAIYTAGEMKLVVRGYTSDKGVFQYKLPAGAYEVQAGWQQFPSGRAEFKVRVGQKTDMKLMIAEKMD